MNMSEQSLLKAYYDFSRVPVIFCVQVAADGITYCIAVMLNVWKAAQAISTAEQTLETVFKDSSNTINQIEGVDTIMSSIASAVESFTEAIQKTNALCEKLSDYANNLDGM